MNRRERISQDRLKELIKGNELYPDFVKWMKKVSDKQLATQSLSGRLRMLNTLQRKYGLDLIKLNIEETMTKVNEEDISAVTVNNYSWNLRKWIEYRGVTLDEETEKWFKRKRGPRKRKLASADLLTADERTLILGETRSQALRAYLAVLWDTGARPSEISQMTIEDAVEDKHGFIMHVHQTKYEKKLRPVRMLDPHSIAVFGDWYIVHPKLGIDETAPLFLTNRQDMMSVKHITDHLYRRFNPRLGRGTGQKASVNLYLYRKSRITHLLKEQILTPIQLKTRIGHTKQSTVLEEYYAILDEVDQAEVELKYLGVVSDEKQYERVIPCPQCGAPNLENATRCFRCRQALSEKALVKDQESLVDSAVSKILAEPENLQALADIVTGLIESQEESDQQS